MRIFASLREFEDEQLFAFAGDITAGRATWRQAQNHISFLVNLPCFMGGQEFSNPTERNTNGSTSEVSSDGSINLRLRGQENHPCASIRHDHSRGSALRQGDPEWAVLDARGQSSGIRSTPAGEVLLHRPDSSGVSRLQPSGSPAGHAGPDLPSNGGRFVSSPCEPPRFRNRVDVLIDRVMMRLDELEANKEDTFGDSDTGVLSEYFNHVTGRA